MTEADPFRVQTEWLDLPALVGAFSRRLHEAGVPSTAERAAHFATGADAGEAGVTASPVLDGAGRVRV